MFFAEIYHTSICIDTASRMMRTKNRRYSAGKKVNMNVNGVTSTQAAYSSYTSAAKESTAAETAKSTAAAEGSGVVYEHSAETTDSAKKTYKPNTSVINQLKADAEARTSQLRSLVEQMMSKQSTLTGRPMTSGNSCAAATTRLILPPDCRPSRISPRTAIGA